MDEAGVPLFSTDALTALDRQVHDPKARASYDVLAGGLTWPDEFPAVGTPGWSAVSENWVYRLLIAYRASVTLGQERAEFRPVWDQVVRHAPNWPGLRPDRRGEKARRRLLAASRCEDRFLAEMEAEIDAADA